MEARFNPKVLLHRLVFPADVKEIMMVKDEVPEDPRRCADLHDPKLHHIKEEQEGVCISLGGEQLSGKEEIDAIRFPVIATAIKSEDDKHSSLVSQLYEDHINGRELPEKNNGGESIKMEDYGDGSNSLEDTEEDGDVKHPVFELKHFSDSGLKTKDMDNDYKESGAPVLDENLVDRVLSASEITEQLFHCYSLQKHITDSEMGFPSLLDDNRCLTENQIVDSRRKVQSGVKFSCEDCGKTFIHEQTLNTHMRIHTGQKPFCCDLCGHRFSHKSNLNTHTRIHTGQKPFCCDLCGRRFSQKGHVNRHMTIHTGQKPFSCDLCGQRFTQKSYLKIHLKFHTEEKPFCCDICGHRFINKSNLSKHLRIHTGQKPFGCDRCGYRCIDISSLNKHTRTHTGQKPYYCDVCGKSFTGKSSLSTHMRIHTGQKPFCCDLCGNRFSEKAHLVKHMVVHTGQKPFHCDLCGRRFTAKSSLKKHMKIPHRTETFLS